MAVAFTVVFAISRSRNDSPPVAVASETPGTPAGIIAALEQQAQEKANDAAVWQKLGFAYFSDSRFDDAVRAYEKATALDPAQALSWSALGEARVMMSERDPMPAAAVQAFEKAVSLDPKDPRARYFLAVKKDLSGDHKGAVVDWLNLLEETPADAPWRQDLVRTIEQVGKINQIDVSGRLAAAGAKSPPAAIGGAMPNQMPIAAQPIPGPSAQDLAGASKIPPGEQEQMAQGMVSRLEARLQGDPSNVNGWVMLMRSRMMLNEPAKASKALADAVKANPGQAAMLKQQAEILGVR